MTLCNVGPRWLPLVAGAGVLISIDGMPLGRWLHGVNGSFSIPCVCVLLDFFTAPLLKRPFLDERARWTIAWMSFFSGLFLFPMALGVGSFDPYQLGNGMLGITTVAGVTAMVLLWNGNRAGWVLVVTGICWQARCLESENAWDYLIDPILFAMCCLQIFGATLLKGYRLLKGIVRGESRVARAKVVGIMCCILGVHMPSEAATAQIAEQSPEKSSSLATIDDIDEAWALTATKLQQRAAALKNELLAEMIDQWKMTTAGDVQHIFRIPQSVERPVDLHDAAAIDLWNDFVTARKKTAESEFFLSVKAAQEGRRCESLQLLYRVLRNDPDHALARNATGWVRHGEQWIFPEVARRLDAGEEYEKEFGWMSKDRLARYKEGQRYVQGKWKTAAEDAARLPPLEQGWKVSSDHWKIVSTKGIQSAVQMAEDLEETFTVWQQVFGCFAIESEELSKRLTGRSHPRTREIMLAVSFRDREQYIADLKKFEPSIARSLGFYYPVTKTVYLFVDDEENLLTVHHEATHQLFAEIKKSNHLVGERYGFWAIEAAACYMEGLVQTPYGWRLGGIEAGRVPAARHRFKEDQFYVPLIELTRMGRADFQSDPRLPQIYSQISGLADFFMNGKHGHYRQAFMEYLSHVYRGTINADSLEQLCKQTLSVLDEEYREHILR